MKKNKNRIISFISLFLISSGAYAATENNSSLLSYVGHNALFSDSKVKVTLRNMWKSLKSDDLAPKYAYDSQAWGQGITLDYNSGYLLDFIGFDASFYSAFKLYANDDFYGRAILGKNQNGDAVGYTKIGQRYAKLKFDWDPLRIDAKAGWMVTKDMGILKSSTRLSTNSYIGYYGKASLSDFYAQLLYTTSTSRRDSADRVPFTRPDKTIIDHIITGEVAYKTKNTFISYFYGDAEDFIQQHGLEASFKILPKLAVNTQIYGQIASDKDQMKSMSKRTFDEQAWHYAADIKWSEPSWSLKLGTAYTDAKKEGGVGYYDRNLIGNSRGRFNSTADADIDYTRDGELYFSMDYNYKITPNYSVGIMGSDGMLNYKDNFINSYGVTLYTIWAPEEIKNLSLYADVGYGWHYKNDAKTPVLDSNGKYQRAHSLASSLNLVYSFSLL